MEIRVATAASAYSSVWRMRGLQSRNPFAYLTNQSMTQDVQTNRVLFQLAGHLRGTGMPNLYEIRRFSLWFILVFQCLCFTCGWPLVTYYFSRFISNVVKTGIEEFDRDVMGVDIEIGDLHPDVVHGIIHIEDLVVRNPAGWDSPYLLRAGVLHIDFDMQELILSGFTKVEVEKLQFKDVSVIYEKGWRGSNVQDVLDFMDKRDKALKASTQPPATTEDKSAGKGKVSCGNSKKEKEKQSTIEDEASFKLHKVKIKDVGMRVQGQMMGGRGFLLSIGDIAYQDFSKEVGDYFLDDIVQVLLKSVLKTMLANVIGTSCSNSCL
jgi:hypothetical protein